MAGFGEFALLLAVASAAWSLLAALQSARNGRADLARSAQGGLAATALSLSAASVALVILLLRKDFSVVYVVEYTSRAMSTVYTLGAFWAGQAGSLLLWAWLASLAGYVAVRQARRSHRLGRAGLAYAVAALAAVALLFSALVAFAANPFDRMPVAMPDGQGLNLLLQNYGQLIHPVTLYLGMVGLAVPFAYCLAALAAGRGDDAWVVAAHRWTMWSWIFLTIGVALGMQWSYVELGWGGYWAWDPVENASLLPWLTATAFLHTAPLQRYRGALRVWNPVLVFASFALSLLGTFLTRSGVVSSVHAFGESKVGPFLLAGILATVVTSGNVLVWRLPTLRGGTKLGGSWSGDGAIVLGNALLAAMAAVVLWGTVFPLTSKAFRGEESSVGPSFYQTLVAPMTVVVLVAVGAYPMLRRRRSGDRGIPGGALRAAAAGLLVLALAAMLDHGRHMMTALVVGLAAAVAVAVAEPVAVALVRRLRGSSDRAAPARVGRRQIGAAVAHIGLAVFIAAIAIHTGLRQHSQVTLQGGQSATLGQYTVRLDSVDAVQRGAQQATVATMSITGAGGRSLGSLTSEQLTTDTQQQPVAEVGIRSTLAEDLYLALEGVEPSGDAATIGIYINPAIAWIWAGAWLIVAGGVLAAWPDRWARPVRLSRAERSGELVGAGVPVRPGGER